MNNYTIISKNQDFEITLRVWMLNDGESMVSVLYQKMISMLEIPLGKVINKKDLLGIFVGFQKMGHTYFYMNPVYRQSDWVKYAIDDMHLSFLDKGILNDSYHK
jgi:hypothetical protein